MGKSKWITPFLKQSFVSIGVAVNLSQFSSVLGFTAILLPQLRSPDSIISIDDEAGSWIAAVPGFALMIGTLTIPTIMAKLGRKRAHIISIIPVFIGWIIITTCKTVPMIISARLLQGLSMGMITSLGPVLIAEYTSSKNRGMFFSMMTVILSLASLSVHIIGSYISWKTTAVVWAIVSAVDLVIVLLSPESPSWLVDQGRYEEGRKVFHWLRGDTQDEELNQMIETNKVLNESKPLNDLTESLSKKTKKSIIYFNRALTKKEFYKPVIIMIHIYAVAEWGGLNFLTPFTIDVISEISGASANATLFLITVDVQRLLSNSAMIYVIKRVKRRTLLLSTTGLAIVTLLVTSGYTYAKTLNSLPFDHPIIGGILIHIHMFTIATGSLPLPLIIAGEIFPLEYRSLGSGISAFFFSINFIVSIKTFSMLCTSIGIYGAYTIYAGILAYCMLIAWLYLPETKDKTLLEIEDEFKGKSIPPADTKAALPLTSWHDKEFY